jgi:hypothetical protein
VEKRKTSLDGNRTSTVQPVAFRYIDWTIPADYYYYQFYMHIPVVWFVLYKNLLWSYRPIRCKFENELLIIPRH